MLVSLVFAALASHWPFDQVRCPAPGPPNATAQSPLPDARWKLVDAVTPSVTNVDDAMAFPVVSGVQWFPAHAGGRSNGNYVVFDASSNTIYECGYADTVREFMILRPKSAPVAASYPAPIHWRSAKGIALGASMDDVRRVYGKANVQRLPGGDSALAYSERRLLSARTAGVIKTTFVFRGGVLVGIFRQAGI